MREFCLANVVLCLVVHSVYNGHGVAYRTHVCVCVFALSENAIFGSKIICEHFAVIKLNEVECACVHAGHFLLLCVFVPLTFLFC